jgi:hypothetical protein
MGTSTPWGTADYSEKVVRGIMQYGTPSHGGIHLSVGRQREMPEVLRVDSGWYEEDCDWCLVAVAFPQYFVKDYAQALSTMRNWHPDRYEKHFGVELKPEESYMRRKGNGDNS